MKIALLGYGVEGQSAYNYYSQQYPDAQFMVYENAAEPKLPLPEGVEFYGNRESFHDIDADIVIKTPAIPPKNVSSSGEVSSVTKEFFAKCPAPIVGVTGTKGKGTTCTLIAEILKAAGKNVWLVGNIGKPALDVLKQVQPGDIVVYELSSFQLWDMDHSPHIAVVLMIEDEHLDVHANKEDYIQAKSNITTHQTSDDIAIYFADNKTSQYIGESSPGKKIPFRVEEGENITIEGHTIAAKNEIGLIGQHNLQNVYAALYAAWQYSQDAQAIYAALKEFKGLPHRLSFVREVNGVKYYDDSISTTPGSAIAALQSFSQPKTIILGGRSKGADFSELARVVKDTHAYALLIGDEAENIAQQLQAQQYTSFEIMQNTNLSQVVKRASELAAEGGVVLLSPACSSIGEFKNYVDRGDQFQQAVNQL